MGIKFFINSLIKFYTFFHGKICVRTLFGAGLSLTLNLCET